MQDKPNLASHARYHEDWDRAQFEPLEGESLREAKALQDAETASVEARMIAGTSSTYNEHRTHMAERSRMTPAQRINHEIDDYERARR